MLKIFNMIIILASMLVSFLVQSDTRILSIEYLEQTSPSSKVTKINSRQYKSNTFGYLEKSDFFDWTKITPHIRTNVLIANNVLGAWGAGKECSGAHNFETISKNGGMFTSAEYFDGEFLNIPGKVLEKLHYVGGSHPKKTKSNWQARCKKNKQGKGEMFIVESPYGLTYTFNEKVVMSVSLLKNDTGSIGLATVYLYVNSIEDRFENKVIYHYDNVKTGRYTYKVLNKISSSDGGVIYLHDDLTLEEKRLISGSDINGSI